MRADRTDDSAGSDTPKGADRAAGSDDDGSPRCHLYGAHPVTPRVATALEDHAMELIASVLDVRPSALANALQHRRALEKTNSDTLRQLLSPFNDSWQQESATRSGRSRGS